MKKGLEQRVMMFLFVLVLVIFSFAEKDSKKLDRLYKTTQLLRNNNRVQTVQREQPVQVPVAN